MGTNFEEVQATVFSNLAWFLYTKLMVSVSKPLHLATCSPMLGALLHLPHAIPNFAIDTVNHYANQIPSAPCFPTRLHGKAYLARMGAATILLLFSSNGTLVLTISFSTLAILLWCNWRNALQEVYLQLAPKTIVVPCF